jgi:RNA polymerase sigma-70 factor (ECF subfamily)
MTPEWRQLLNTGDPTAWSAFVDRSLPIVASAVSRTLPHASLADQEDVIQDVFVRLCQNDYRLMRQYDPEKSSLSTWLTVISRGVAIDALRKAGRQLRTEPIDLAHAPTHEPTPIESISLPAGILSPRETAVLTLLFDHGFDAEEVAEKLAIHPQTVRSTKHNALSKLRRHLGENPQNNP